MAGRSGGTQKQAAAGVGLFATPSGVRAVQSKAQTEILSVLAERELPFDEIVQRSGKAKSTVSVHLQGLVRDGIVAEKTDTVDSRKKIFFLRSPYIGGLAAQKPVIPGQRGTGGTACRRSGPVQVLPSHVPDDPGIALKRGHRYRPRAQECRATMSANGSILPSQPGILRNS
jgi:Bacterial regulatory protein, arsR family.